MKRLVLFLLLLAVPAIMSCGGTEAENTAPLCQYNYLTADLAAYGQMNVMRLDGMVLTLPAEYREAEEAERRHALEEVMTAHLVASAEITALVAEDVAYQRDSLMRYLEAMRLYDNTVIEQYGDLSDLSADLDTYLMRAFDLPSPAAVQEELTRTAEALARDNLAIALAFHALSLVVTEEMQARVTASLLEELGEAPTDSAYLANEALYMTLMDHLLDPVRCTVRYE